MIIETAFEAITETGADLLPADAGPIDPVRLD
jgi:hypothetical protein